MSSQETSNNPEDSEALDAETQNGDLASKLSKELSNWRRKRGGPAARFHNDRAISSKAPLSEPARTIKVRGHETLVIRKSRPTGKPRPDSPSPHE
jgi:hypothetical protein